jgi:hypothetical protein
VSLEEAQAKLDNIQTQLLDNKNARLRLQDEAKELRAQYFEVQVEREQLLKLRLTPTEGAE